MKTNGTRRVLIPVNGQDNRAIAMAIKLGIEFARKVSNEVESVALYLPNKKSILDSSLATVVSPKIAKLLHIGEQVPMGEGLVLRAVTVRTFKNGSNHDIVIAIGADSKMMLKIDGMEGLHTVIAVPQKDGALDEWTKNWSPIIPGAKKKDAGQVKIDPVIADALSALGVGIDMSVHGLAGQDRKQVENMIRLLKQNRHQEEPVNLHAWAVKNGWHADTADDLVKIWVEVYELKSNQKAKDVAPAIKPEAGILPLTFALPKRAMQKASTLPLRLSKGGEGIRRNLITP